MATSFRWFVTGCCECAGEHCLAGGSTKPRYSNPGNSVRDAEVLNIVTYAEKCSKSWAIKKSGNRMVKLVMCFTRPIVGRWVRVETLYSWRAAGKNMIIITMIYSCWVSGFNPFGYGIAIQLYLSVLIKIQLSGARTNCVCVSEHLYRNSSVGVAINLRFFSQKKKSFQRKREETSSTLYMKLLASSGRLGFVRLKKYSNVRMQYQ